MPGPFFSIVIPTYDRLELVTRCIHSCLAQSFRDFEVIVVDDASTDGTYSALGGRYDPRVRIFSHDSNRGIDPSRYTGVSHSRGEWILVVDSDWELFPHTLRRVHEIISRLPLEVRVVRSRVICDGGRITPFFVPEGAIGYEERLRWVDEEGGHDDMRCAHRSVFDSTPYFHCRRGAMETLYELNLAKNETSLYVKDVLCREHFDAANSYLRSVNREELVPRLLREAPDMLWMAETALREHGEALMRYGPRQYRVILRSASVQAFLAGRRTRGLRHGFQYLRLKRADLVVWSTLVLGLLGPSAVAHGSLVYRRAVRVVANQV